MIAEHCTQPEWIEKARLKYSLDPGLLEKNIYALMLLEQLQLSGLPFTFKGGTALQLLLSQTTRLSKDIDIVVHPAHKVRLEACLQKVNTRLFPHFGLNERESAIAVPKAHYKFLYNGLYGYKHEKPDVLLDVLFEENRYTDLLNLPVKTAFTEHEGDEILVSVPTVEAILGDKMTAFAPNTIGVPYNRSGADMTMEVLKQCHDIARLSVHVQDWQKVRLNFNRFTETESGYEGREVYIPEQVLEDAYQTALCICSDGKLGTGQIDLLSRGMQKIGAYSFIKPYNKTAIQADAAKAAWAARQLLTGSKAVFPVFDPAAKPVLIENPDLNKLNKALKAANPEALFYWKAIEGM
ncbi:MAG: nucleotidyl transferase AbiEii/AbiGii toxin family protein [Bacteroidota bacterium]